MANRLKKVAAVRYSAGSPARPATQGYNQKTRVFVPEHNGVVVDTYVDMYGDYQFALYPGPRIPAHYEYVTTWVPGTPARPAVAPVFSYSAIAGWNGGARSREVLSGDGIARFSVSSLPRGVVAGLTAQDLDTSPGDIEFGFYVHGSAIEVYEDGVSKYSFALTADEDTTFEIWRELGVITYVVVADSDEGVDEAYTSLKTSDQPLMLDATLYSTGDFVDNPEFEQYVPYGEGATVLPAYVAYGRRGVKANGGSKLRAPQAIGFSGFRGTGATILPPYTVVGAVGGYTYGSSNTPMLRISGNGGYPAEALQYGMAWLTGQESFGHGLTGEIGSGGSTLRAYKTIGSDYPYSYGGSAHMPVEVVAYDYAEAGGERTEVEALVLRDVYVGIANQAASLSEYLQLGDVWTTGIVASDMYFDSLLLGTVLTTQQAISAVLMSALALSDSSNVSSTLNRQYAVNIATGAVSPYTNFGFSAFARCGQETFGTMSDGLYRMRRGDDNGTPISASVDFGEVKMASSTSHRHIEDVFLAVDTDGTMQLTTKVDGVDYTYDVLRRAELSRAVLSRSLRGRSWNVSLSVVSASVLDLEFIEVHTHTSKRWST